MRRCIGSIEELVAAFGGSTALGDWLGVGASAVSNWQARNSIPTGWHLRLYLEAQRRHLDINLELFGFSEADAPSLRIAVDPTTVTRYVNGSRVLRPATIAEFMPDTSEPQAAPAPPEDRPTS